MSDDTNATRAAGSSAPACCVCGCEFFVWWIREQGRYSSETPWEYYDRERHPRAVCCDCNRDVPRTHNNGLRQPRAGGYPAGGAA